MGSKTTIKDLANEAGVSITTVSLILNGKGEKFSEKTRKKY
ncbi:LacI family DNA-binding transcriptional regulator [Weissella paramesenteroides]